VALFTTFILGTYAILAAGLVTNFALFTILLFFAGSGINPFLSFCFVLLSESGSELYRQLVTIALLFCWTFGEMLAVAVVYWANANWQVLCVFCLGIPLAVQTVTYLWVYESPKFLATKGDYDATKKLIKRIALVNGKKMKGDYEFVDEMDQYQGDMPNDLGESLTSSLVAKQKVRGYRDLFKYKSLAVVTIAGSYMYFTIQLVYYGAIFALNNLAGDLYVNSVLIALAEFLGYVASVPIIRKFKRKISFVVSFLLAGLASLSFIIFEIPSSCNQSGEACWQKDIQIFLAMITRLMVSIGFLIIYLYLNELYPTPVRSLGTGFCTFSGRLGSITSPLLVNALTRSGINPWIAFGFFSVVAAAVSLAMRETFGMPLQNEIQEDREDRMKSEAERLDKSNNPSLYQINQSI